MHFADLHDTPGRMKAKGVIRKLVPWAESRSYFYWRLTRRLREFELYDKVMNGIPTASRSTRKQFTKDLRSFYATSLHIDSADLEECWDEDRKVLSWLNEQSSRSVQEFFWQKRSALQGEQIASRVQDLVGSATSSSAVVAALQQSFQSLSAEEKALLQAALQ